MRVRRILCAALAALFLLPAGCQAAGPAETAPAPTPAPPETDAPPHRGTRAHPGAGALGSGAQAGVQLHPGEGA